MGLRSSGSKSRPTASRTREPMTVKQPLGRRFTSRSALSRRVRPATGRPSELGLSGGLGVWGSGGLGVWPPEGPLRRAAGCVQPAAVRESGLARRRRSSRAPGVARSVGVNHRRQPQPPRDPPDRQVVPHRAAHDGRLWGQLPRFDRTGGIPGLAGEAHRSATSQAAETQKALGLSEPSDQRRGGGLQTISRAWGNASRAALA